MLNREEYKKYLKSIFDFMVKGGYTKLPYPKIILDKSKQDPILGKTAYFDPNDNSIRLFINNRLEKDIFRSFCHECIHYKQQMEGDIEKSGYSGDKITEDKNLIHLEAEAYLKGNMAFRSWTETLQKQNGIK